MHSVCSMSAHISPAQAAKRANVSRWTIIRALKSHGIKGFRDNRGHWRIDPESVDAWSSAHPMHTEQNSAEKVPAHASGPTVEVEALRTEVRLLREQIERESEIAQRQLDDMRDRAMKAEARDDESRENLKLLIKQLSRAEQRRRWWPF